jgi:hypothetical protein
MAVGRTAVILPCLVSGVPLRRGIYGPALVLELALELELELELELGCKSQDQRIERCCRSEYPR